MKNDGYWTNYYSTNCSKIRCCSMKKSSGLRMKSWMKTNYWMACYYSMSHANLKKTHDYWRRMEGFDSTKMKGDCYSKNPAVHDCLKT